MITSNNLDELCGYAGISIGLAGYSKKVVIGMDQTDDDALRKMANAVNSERFVMHNLSISASCLFLIPLLESP